MRRTWNVSQLTAEGTDPMPNTAVISIRKPGDPVPRLHEGWEHVLYLQFDDTDFENDPNAFTDEMLDTVIRWVESLPNDYSIMVHCAAGISRSSAMCLGLSDMFTIQADVAWGSHPNNLVLRLFHKRLWL